MNRKLYDTLALLGFCAMVYWFSDQPRLPTLNLLSNQDKILHAATYAVMAVLAWRFFSHASPRKLIIFIATITYCSIFGISDEWHQSFVPNRNPDIYDWVADTSGAMAAAMLLWQRPRRRNTKRIKASLD